MRPRRATEGRMKVDRQPLEGTQIVRLVVVDPGESEHHVGEVVGYRCPECNQADESLQQIWHQEDCSYAGQHGRAHYDDLHPDIDKPAPELEGEHRITMVRAAGTDSPDVEGGQIVASQGVHNGEVLKFLCDECQNGDEDVFEIVHDEACELSDPERDGLTCPETLQHDE